MKSGQLAPIKFLAYFKRLELISDSPTNSKISPYSSTKRFPQKVVPRIPVPTNATFSFEVLLNANVEIGKAELAASIPIELMNFLLVVFIGLIFNRLSKYS